MNCSFIIFHFFPDMTQFDPVSWSCWIQEQILVIRIDERPRFSWGWSPVTVKLTSRLTRVSLCPLPSSLLLPHAARSLIVAVISVIHIASLTCLLFAQSSHTSLPSLIYLFHPAALLSVSSLPFLSLISGIPFPPFTHFHLLISPANMTSPPSCSLITHKLTLKASIIAYVKTHTNAQSTACLTGLILFPCTVSHSLLIHMVFMLNDWCLTILHFPLH